MKAFWCVLLFVVALFAGAAALLFAPAADAQTLCAASDPASLNQCIVDYNGAAAGTATRIEMSNDVTLSSSLIFINNATGALLVVDGNGFTLDGNGAVASGLAQEDGVTEITNITVTGATSNGISVFGGTAVISNSTMTGNGAGVFTSSSTETQIVNSSLVLNTFDGVALGSGDSVFVQYSTVARNGRWGIEDSFASSRAVGSIIAANPDGDCNGGTHTDDTGNVYGDTSCTGTATQDLLNPDTFSSTLADNACTPVVGVSGCTQTLELFAGSPAIDAHTGATCDGLLDQHGTARANGLCDAGADEFDICSLSLFVVTSEVQLAQAITCYNAGTSNVDIVMTNAITLTGDLPAINNTQGLPPKLMIDGNGFTLDGNGAVSDVLRQGAGDTEITNITVTGGTDDGIEVSAGAAVISKSTITGNDYGVFANSLTEMQIVNSTIALNAIDGVYLAPDRSVFVQYSTVARNGRWGIEDSFASSRAVGSIIAANTDGDCNTGTHTDEGGNVYGDTSCTGVAKAGLNTSFSSTLADNSCTPVVGVSGCTQTLALFPGSPAVDQHTGATCTGLLDQHGTTRTDGLCDAGAFESDFAAALCDGQVATIDMNFNGGDGTGTPGDDVIIGTSSADVINAGAGRDTVCAGDGIDTVNAGFGSDRVFGEGGDDTINGEGNADFLVGGQGVDTITGGDKADRIYGDDFLGGASGGNDILSGDSGSDLIYGGAGNDTINGGIGNDRLFGQQGVDTINGDNGDDKIYGGTANDILSGGNDRDKIWGETGNDTISGNAGDDFHLDGDAHNDKVYGGGGNDVVHGGTGRDRVYGQGGNDDVRAQAGDDFVTDGGPGTDSCQVAPEDTPFGDAPAINCES